jgi:hypothetical protein
VATLQTGRTPLKVIAVAERASALAEKAVEDFKAAHSPPAFACREGCDWCCHLHRLPHLHMLVLRSKDIGIIGVGEGTTLPVASHLHGYLRLDQAEFYRIAQPTWKLGVRFLNWGPRPHFDYALGWQFDYRFPGLSRPF